MGRYDQLEQAIQAACQITGRTEVISVGSHVVLGSFADELPFKAIRLGSPCTGGLAREGSVLVARPGHRLPPLTDDIVRETVDRLRR